MNLPEQLLLRDYFAATADVSRLEIAPEAAEALLGPAPTTVAEQVQYQARLVAITRYAMADAMLVVRSSPNAGGKPRERSEAK